MRSLPQPTSLLLSLGLCVLAIAACDRSKPKTPGEGDQSPAASASKNPTTTTPSPTDLASNTPGDSAAPREPDPDPSTSAKLRDRAAEEAPQNGNAETVTNKEPRQETPATPSNAEVSENAPIDSQSSEDTIPAPGTNESAPVFRPESVGIGAPIAQEPEPETPVEESDRSFATLQPLESEVPKELVLHLEAIDQALSDLVLTGSTDLLTKEDFVKYGLRLGNMKLQAGESLANLEAATADQRKAGVLAQLIALSHMSGLGDVKSAQALEKLAQRLADAEDADLSHQSRVVLLGFEIQALQNGQKSKPDSILNQVKGLFARPEDRNFSELMMVQQAIVVMADMGFKEAAENAKQTLASEYTDSTDAQLRDAAWSFLVQGDQALENYNQASNAAIDSSGSAADLVAAARVLHDAFPSTQTLEGIARSLANMEYSGAIESSRALAEFVGSQLVNYPENAAGKAAKTWINDHQTRMAMLGQPIELMNVIDFDGNEFDFTEYKGKVVLVDFWASWCMPCIKEIPQMREAYKNFQKDGLEIIGINMDDDLEAAKKFLLDQKLPWKNYRFSDAAGFDSAFAKKHGIRAIPFMALVDKEGNVQQLHVRGERLVPTVRTALGIENNLDPTN